GDPIDKAIFNKIEESEELSKKIKEYQTLKFNPFDPVCKSTEAEIEYRGETEFSVSKGAPQVILSRL
ncbi:MAG TPA: hypothetical protein VK444_01130, partial [Methanobacteriaceae archaeon]|nr:hypothetical protein [Methanobacteriaceae archaeon]